MAFPEKKHKWFSTQNVGWKDLGKINDEVTRSKGITTRIEVVHGLCMTPAHIGKESTGDIFRFCPRCLNKLKE